MQRKRILVFVSYYLPGYKAGGPVRALANMIECIGSECDIKIVTRDHDLKERKPYSGVQPGQWNKVGGQDIFYCPPGMPGLLAIARLIKETPYDILYLNSFFDPLMSIFPLLCSIPGQGSSQVVVAPHGEFSHNALRLKALKKTLYIQAAKLAGFYNDVTWHTSTEYEAKDLRNAFPRTKDSNIKIARNLAGGAISCSRNDKKRQGELKIIFLSRISRMKNLAYALDLLRTASGNVRFDIYGPLEDSAYFEHCRSIMEALPPNVEANYLGATNADKVVPTFMEYDLLLLPTLGENFCHVIAEALSAGCPVLVSDETPWRNLADHGVGWELPLAQPELWKEKLQYMVDMGWEEHHAMSKSALEFFKNHCNDRNAIEQNLNLFLPSRTEALPPPSSVG